MKRRRLERGETLLELLITISIMGGVIITVLAGIAVAVNSSDENKKDVGVQVVLRDYAEAVKAAPYAGCAQGAYDLSYMASIHYVAPSGFALKRLDPPQVEVGPVVTGCYDTTNGSWCTPDSSCTDRGAVRLRLTVSTIDADGPHQRSKSLELVEARDYVRPS